MGLSLLLLAAIDEKPKKPISFPIDRTFVNKIQSVMLFHVSLPFYLILLLPYETQSHKTLILQSFSLLLYKPK